jgi:hypothetical protein
LLSGGHFSYNIRKIIISAFRAAFLERENNMLKKELEDANFRSLLVQCCGTWMFIPDLGSEFFPSWISDPNFSILDPGSASENLSNLT